MPSTFPEFLEKTKKKKMTFALIGQGMQWKLFLEAEVVGAVAKHKANADSGNDLVTGLARFARNKHSFVVDGNKEDAKKAMKAACVASNEKWSDAKYEIKGSDEEDAGAPNAGGAAPAAQAAAPQAGFKTATPSAAQAGNPGAGPKLATPKTPGLNPTAAPAKPGVPSKPQAQLPGTFTVPDPVKHYKLAKPMGPPIDRFRSRFEMMMPELNLAGTLDPDIVKKSKAAFVLSKTDPKKALLLLDQVDKELAALAQKEEIVRLASQVRIDWSKVPKPVTDPALEKSYAAVVDSIRQRDTKATLVNLNKFQKDADGNLRQLAVLRAFCKDPSTAQISMSNWAKRFPTLRAKIAKEFKMTEDEVDACCQKGDKERQAEIDKLRPKGFVPGSPAAAALGSPNPVLSGLSRPSLTLDEAKAVQAYSEVLGENPNRPGEFHPDYAPFNIMNKALRPKPPKMVDPPHDQTLKKLQDAIAKVKPFPTPVPVVRGMNFSNAEDLRKFVKQFKDNIGKDELIPLRGFTSTATSGIPQNFEGNVAMNILAKQGLDLLPYTSAPHERELLLNHETLVKTIRVNETRTPKGIRYDITVEQILIKKKA